MLDPEANALTECGIEIERNLSGHERAFGDEKLASGFEKIGQIERLAGSRPAGAAYGVKSHRVQHVRSVLAVLFGANRCRRSVQDLLRSSGVTAERPQHRLRCVSQRVVQ